jgi:hypothetical protein
MRCTRLNDSHVIHAGHLPQAGILLAASSSPAFTALPLGRGRMVWPALMALRAATPPARLPSRHEPFDARHHWSGSSRSIWSKSLSALGALKEVERRRREAVVPSDR